MRSVFIALLVTSLTLEACEKETKESCQPVVEDCATTADENCDGISTCSGEVRWAERFGDVAFDYGAGVAFDAVGSIEMTGGFESANDFGPTSTVAAGRSFVVSLGADGTPLRSVPMMGPLSGGVIPSAHPSGDTIVYSSFEGTLSIGDRQLLSAGASDVALFALRPDGGLRWLRHFGNERAQRGLGIRFDPQGDVTISGFSEGGSIDFGGGPLRVEGLVCGNFVAQFDAGGVHRWSRLFQADDNIDWGLGLAVDASGEVILSGQIRGNADLGGGILPGGRDIDLVLARFDRDGTLLWSKRFGDSSDQLGSVAVTRGGDAYVFGRFQGTLDFGLGALTSTTSMGSFVAMLAPDGQPLWSRSFIGTGEVYSATVDDADQLLLAGHFSESIDFGCGPLVSAGQRDAFVAKLDRTGRCVWSRRFGDAGVQWAQGIAVDALGNIVVTGTFEGSMAPTPLESAGNFDLFVLTLLP